MKIVDVSAFYAPEGGGVKTYVEQKIRALAARGHELVVVAPSDRDAIEPRGPGCRIVHLASPTMPLDRRYRYFAEAGPVHAVLDAERPDFVEASSPWRTASIVAGWQGAAPRALVMHADPLAAYAYRWFGPIAERATIDRHFQWFWNHLRRNARRFDRVICANHGFAARLSAGGVAHVATVPLGIDAGIFSPVHRDEALRADLLARCGLGPDARLLLGIGRHSPEKRWPMVIDACQRASLKRPIGLVLVGGGRDSARIRRHIGGNPHVHLLAPVRDRMLLARLMASADALIHGCEAETYGLAAAEAAASGLPLIVPAEGGAADLLLAGQGERYRPASSRSAAAAIDRLFARDIVGLHAATRAAAGRIATIDDHFDRLIADYTGLSTTARIVA
ncbi:glycosyltransferase [Sphingomonas histidinilytica]|jgi:alpha-1,6-mannosyltransferase|uniref:Alpha-1,6-mannosyltransferase n=1 Tax=Rhizorhabdus histidinilytica TaxID=439228 RepID=A0A1T5CZ58_9SPHN|nr:glycosyltransferase [Rhizorhabdus histidinilytica]MBO9376346.1 glycosyltransferase [Rhizorhabdus histidinilytica]QEH79148.1 glycosyltransferase family 1 protein [Sphingomonas sp. C8-2]SKB64679.1 alpha-1,6-mannosyltransferase [Rhizorhabdus histidinilytica]